MADLGHSKAFVKRVFECHQKAKMEETVQLDLSPGECKHGCPPKHMFTHSCVNMDSLDHDGSQAGSKVSEYIRGPVLAVGGDVCDVNHRDALK